MNVVMFDSKPHDIEFFKEASEGINIRFSSHKLSSDLTPDRFRNRVKGMDAIVVFVNDVVDKARIDILKEEGVGCICTRSAGFNHIDIDYANKQGIKVLRVPSYSPNAVAEQAIALLMSVVRKTHRAYLKSKINDFTLNGLLGFDIFGKDVAVYGCGRIGKIFAQIMIGFGAHVHVYDAYPDMEWIKKTGVKLAKSTDDLFKNADIISLHAPLFKDNHHIICEKTIDMMRDGVVIINASRGALINTKDLIKGLRTGKIAGAGLDVYENETEFSFEDRSSGGIEDPLFMELIQLNNVVFTPHSAFFTQEALTQISQVTINNLNDYNNGNELVNEVKND